MKKYCEKMDFRNHLNIFISSSMSDENGFAWRDLRKKIKARLNECPLLNTFIIEDQCDSMPSVQYFKNQVAMTDIVILLLKSTARQGTCMEFDIVKENHKQLFPYFIKSDDIDLSVREIKEELKKRDYCTYYEYDPKSVNKLEDIIYVHIMNSLINRYKMRNLSDTELQDTAQEYTIENISKKKNSLPKLILQNFDSCYGESFAILNIRKYNNETKEKSNLHDVGIAMLNWLLTGSNFPTNDEIFKIILTMQDFFDNTLWLSKRWEACKCMGNNDLEQALKYENEALECAEKYNLPEWIITDILIDCRNIANKACPFSGQEYQNRLSKTKELVYFPGLDRFCSNLFNDTIEEYQHEFFKSKGEQRFGNNLNEIITEFENCLFISMLYGSYTHIVLAREALVKVLYHYGIIYNGNNFMFTATKLQILCGDSKKFEKIIDHEWESMGNELIANADELFILAMQLSNDDIILTIIKIFMVYFTEESIRLATSYMVNLSENTGWNIVDTFLRTINSANSVINNEDIVIILTNLLKQNIIRNYYVFTLILIQLDISNVSNDTLLDLCNVIKDNIENIVRNNGNPQYISVLIKQRKDIFNCLKDIPNNGLIDDELIFFEMNTENSFDNVEKTQSVLCSQIKDITNQMQVNYQKGYYCEFATRPFLTIKSFVEMPICKFSDIKQLIDDKLIPICIQILKNNIAISLTEDCIECLISIIGEYRKNKLSISNELIDCLMSSENSENEMKYTIFLFNDTTPNNIKYRYLMLKMLCMLDVKDELYYNYLNFNDENETERIAISECLKEYFNINGVSDSILISLAFLLSNDSSHEVRMNACSCLYRITSNESYSNLSYLKLRELSSDVHPNVRHRLLNIYENNNEAQKDERYKDIIFNLTKDAHYFIRRKATEIFSKTLNNNKFG